MTRNAIAMGMARVWSAFTTVVILALVARTRTGDELGAVALGLTVGYALAILPDAGLTSLYIRDASRGPHKAASLMGGILAIRAVLLPAFAALAWGLVWLAFPTHATTIMLVALTLAIQQVGELARAAFVARGRLFIAAGHSVLENLLWLVATGISLARGADLVASFALGAGAVIVIDVCGLILVQRLLHISPILPAREELITLLRDARSFASFSALAGVAARIDTVLIGLLLPSGLIAAGAYYAAARLVEAAEYLPDAVTRAAYPDLSRQYQLDPARMRDLLAPGAKPLIAIGVAVPFGLALVGEYVLNLLYGPEISSFAWLFIALGGIVPFKYAAMLFGTVLTSSDAQGRRAIATGAGLLATIAINLALLPRIGIAAAVLAAYVQWILIAALYARGVNRRVVSLVSMGEVLRAILSAAAAFAVALAVRATGTPWAIPVSGILFSVLVTLPLLVPTIQAARARWNAP